MSSNEKFERDFETFMNEEDSRLAALYRKLPQVEPDAKVDAAVRSMAHRALNPQLVATPRAQSQRRRARWLPAFGAAAGIVLAAGIAWRVETDRRSERNELGAPASDVITVRQLDVPPPSAEAPLSPAPPADSAPSATSTRADGLKAQSAAPASGFAEPAKPASAALEREKAAKLSEQSENQPAAGGALGKVENAAKPAPPQAFPAPAQKRSSEMDAVERKQIMAAGAWQNLHDRDTNKAKPNAKARSLDEKAPAAAAGAAGAPETRTAAPASPARAAVTKSVSAPTVAPTAPRPESTTAPPSTPSSAAQAESATILQAAPPPQVSKQASPMVPQPARESAAPARADAADHAAHDESAPVAAGKDGTRARSADPNAGLYPEHWLANIRSMLKENRRDEALRSLAEFRRMYPDYRLPDDLRDLKP